MYAYLRDDRKIKFRMVPVQYFINEAPEHLEHLLGSQFVSWSDVTSDVTMVYSLRDTQVYTVYPLGKVKDLHIPT